MLTGHTFTRRRQHLADFGIESNFCKKSLIQIYGQQLVHY